MFGWFLVGSFLFLGLAVGSPWFFSRFYPLRTADQRHPSSTFGLGHEQQRERRSDLEVLKKRGVPLGSFKGISRSWVEVREMCVKRFISIFPENS